MLVALVHKKTLIFEDTRNIGTKGNRKDYGPFQYANIGIQEYGRMQETFGSFVAFFFFH